MTQLFGPPIEPRGSQKHRNLGAHRRSRPAPPRHSRAHNGAVSLGFTIAVEDATNKHSCGKPVNTTSVFGPAAIYSYEASASEHSTRLECRAGSSLLDVDTVLALRITIQGETGMSFRSGMEWSTISKRFPFLIMMVLLLFPAIAIRAQSQELTLQFSSSSTSINFTLGDILHTVHGSFRLKSGQVRYDSATATVHGSLLADATSGQSGNHIRDRRMHREILESARYPEIAFRPDRVEGKVASIGTSNLQVHGTFSIHGADHELTLPVRVQTFADHWIADTHFTVPYVKWGVKNPSTFLLRVSESVEIDVHATGANRFASGGGQ